MADESRDDRIARIRRERRENNKVAPTPVGYDMQVTKDGSSRVTFTGVHKDDFPMMLDMVFETGCDSVTLTPTKETVTK